MTRPKIHLHLKTPRIPRIYKKKGKAPGAVIYVGQREGMARTVNIMEYTEEKVTEIENYTENNLALPKEAGLVSWINIIGISDEAYIENLGKEFQMNPLVLEDAVNTNQRPKIDEYEDYIFGVFKMLYLNDEGQIKVEHIALTLFEDRVLVFQEETQDVFGGVRDRIRNKTSRIRSRGADYLYFALIDAIVDGYLEVVENTFVKIEALEEEVYHRPIKDTAHCIQELKKEVIRLHKWIFPVKEIVHRLIDTESRLISKDTKLFFRDALDHCIEVNENLQIYRELSISLMEMYMSNVSNKMNEVMKVLTIMASIFIPLTFIAGIYGMNFEKMPELHWQYGYFVVLGFMLVVLVVMLIFFKRKHWL